jgi:pSer/pThr/pTyr-binding forkhead associated (FHA) protein
VPLQGQRITLGRSSASDLPFPNDNGLSRQHWPSKATADNWALSDLGSKNGTVLNGVKVASRTPLKSGDRIMAGHLILICDATSTVHLSRW